MIKTTDQTRKIPVMIPKNIQIFLLMEKQLTKKLLLDNYCNNMEKSVEK